MPGDLCEDEGCPHYGVPHVCVDLREQEDSLYWREFCQAMGAGWKVVSFTGRYRAVLDACASPLEITGYQAEAILMAIRKRSRNQQRIRD